MVPVAALRQFNPLPTGLPTISEPLFPQNADPAVFTAAMTPARSMRNMGIGAWTKAGLFLRESLHCSKGQSECWDIGSVLLGVMLQCMTRMIERTISPKTIF
jgi:hypothetical protein